MSDAFQRGWGVAKESGPYLNRLDLDRMRSGEEVMPREGYQDFRFPREGEYAMAGNFPDLTNYYPTRYSYKEPDGTILTTLEPAGSNINLSPLLGLMGMGDDEFMLRELASTGRHEAIHQAIHPILRDLGYESRGPSKRKYDRATEWAANLGQHHDPVNAWNALRRHPVFSGNRDISMLADKYIERSSE